MALLTASSGNRPDRAWRRWVRWSLAVTLWFGGLEAKAAVSQEYKLKAVFLYNFAQFVDWPPEAMGSEEKPFVIGVLGDDPFGSALDEVVNGEKVHGRTLLVRRYKQLDEVGDCQVLFIGETKESRLPAVMAALQGKSILTVGEVEGFAKAGGIIRFLNDRNRIRLRINLDAAKAANLRISSKLLRPAEIVGGKEAP